MRLQQGYFGRGRVMAMASKRYPIVFGDFDNGEAFDKIFAAVSQYGFEDNSWHNDTQPCMVQDGDHGFQLTIWVDYKDPDLAEYVDARKDGSVKQFIFCEQNTDTFEITEEWQYDDVDALIAHVKKVMEA